MDTKTCFKCLRDLPCSEFYRHPHMRDGLLGKCKACARCDAMGRIARKKLDPDWVQDERARGRAKAVAYRASLTDEQRARLRGQHTRHAAAWKRRNLHKKAAHDAAQRALKAGKLVMPDCCDACRESGRALQMHHPDYGQPLLVEWLCSGCHGLHHRKAA